MINGEYPRIMEAYLVKNGIMPQFEPGDKELLQDAKPDFIALYYYESTTVEYAPEDDVGAGMEYNLTGNKGDRTLPVYPGLYKVVENKNLDTTDWDWPIDSVGLRLTMLELYDRYKLPLIIAENGLGSVEKADKDGYVIDDNRIGYLSEHIKQMKLAIEEGVEVISYNIWSIVDLISTSNGFTKRYGLVRVNREEQDLLDLRRIPKKSYYWYRDVIASNGSDDSLD